MGSVLIFNGSPRKKGNSAILADEIARGVRESGNNAEVIRLNDLNLHPCQGCDACQKAQNFRCVQKDDMNDLYVKLLAADALVITSPIYWFAVSAQTKMFIDRLYALGNPKGHGLKGKKFAAALIYGDVDPYKSGAVNAIGSLRDAMNYIQCPIVDILYGTAENPGDILKNEELMKNAYKLGKKIAK
jgi:multimeric flavodoxin WrbA